MAGLQKTIADDAGQGHPRSREDGGKPPKRIGPDAGGYLPTHRPRGLLQSPQSGHPATATTNAQVILDFVRRASNGSSPEKDSAKALRSCVDEFIKQHTRAARHGHLPGGDGPFRSRRAERRLQKSTPAEGAKPLPKSMMSHAHRPVSLPPLLPRGTKSPHRPAIGVYDCLYVALGEREGCELITSDMRLIQTSSLPLHPRPGRGLSSAQVAGRPCLPIGCPAARVGAVLARSPGRVQWSRRCPMSTKREKETVTQEEADMEEVCRLAAEGKKVTDPELLKRIRERAGDQGGIRPRLQPRRPSHPRDRSAIGQDDERELTPDQWPCCDGGIPGCSIPRPASSMSWFDRRMMSAEFRL